MKMPEIDCRAWPDRIISSKNGFGGTEGRRKEGKGKGGEKKSLRKKSKLRSFPIDGIRERISGARFLSFVFAREEALGKGNGLELADET